MSQKILYSLLFFAAIFFSACDKNDDEKIQTSTKLSGVVEKGPFIAGSTVSLYELDENLNGTGKVFTSQTNDEGWFEINNSSGFSSKYVKISVNGFYFNEVTGGLSTAPITLEGVADIDKKENINVNLLTHLELPRVTYLVTKENKTFSEAKKQAEKELLEAFYITNQEIVPEETQITGNNVSADILIAISSILLNNKTDAAFSEFISFLREDLKDGKVEDIIKQEIKTSSSQVNTLQIRENIINRYQDLGKEVKVGNFHYFIDHNGDGVLEEYEEKPVGVILPEEFFNSEEKFIAFLNYNFTNLVNYMQSYMIFDALYGNLVDANKANQFKEIYNHQVSPHNTFIKSLWEKAYTTINISNILLNAIEKSSIKEIRQYKYPVMVCRAYTYLSMIELWGDVPFRVSPVDYSSNLNIAKSAKKDILSFLIADMEAAGANLPDMWNTPQEGLPTKYASKSLLSKLYLADGNLLKSYETILEIINSGKFQLESNYDLMLNESGRENIFGLKISNDFSHNDSENYKNLVKKGNMFYFSRYTEVLLTAAEISLTICDGRVVQYLNMVRAKNQRPLLEETTAGTETILSALLEEWKEDLGKEGWWFPTIKRLNKAESILDIPSHKTLLPIPDTELATNSLITQNPGY